MAKNLNDIIHGDRANVRGYKSTKDFFDDGFTTGNYSGGYSGSKSFTNYVRCAESHPALTLPGTDKVIYGGACASPVVKDAQIYIGFDAGMRYSQRSWPWKEGHEFLFHIPDMGVPSSPEEFKKLVKWTKKQIDQGMKVHCGCIGGHGRTGTFLAALCSEYGEKDAVNYVRQHYCKKAVESKSQINFLHEHFGIVKAEGYKENMFSKSVSSSGKGKKGKSVVVKGKTDKFTPQRHPRCVWG